MVKKNAWHLPAMGMTLVLALTGCLDRESPGLAAAEPEKGSEYATDRATGQQYLLNPNRRTLGSGEGLAKSADYIGNRVDGSGQIEMKYYICSQGTNHHNLNVGCSVDPGMVLVGGGAYVDYGSGAGALLTESRPLDWGLVTWVASSKDHYRSNPHTLYVYAIGMRLAGVTRDELLAHMSWTHRTGEVASHPVSDVSVPEGYLLIGGGARNNWSGAGNLLTSSYPASPTTWAAKGKDHKSSSPASITTYAIGIRPNIPGFGSLQIGILGSGGSYKSSGVASDTRDAVPGFLVACTGGISEFQGKGRMLFGLQPVFGNYDGVRAYSKDHVDASGGTTYAYLIQVRRY